MIVVMFVLTLAVFGPGKALVALALVAESVAASSVHGSTIDLNKSCPNGYNVYISGKGYIKVTPLYSNQSVNGSYYHFCGGMSRRIYHANTTSGYRNRLFFYVYGDFSDDLRWGCA